MKPDTAEELAQEWQHRLLNGEPLTKADHAAFIRTALLSERDAGRREGLEEADKMWLPPTPYCPHGHKNFSEQLRERISALPDQEEK